MKKKILLLTILFAVIKLTYSDNRFSIKDYIEMIRSGYSLVTLNKGYNADLTEEEYRKLKKLALKDEKFRLDRKKKQSDSFYKNFENAKNQNFRYLEKRREIQAEVLDKQKISSSDLMDLFNEKSAFEEIKIVKKDAVIKQYKKYKKKIDNEYLNLSKLNHKYEKKIKELDKENESYIYNLDKKSVEKIGFDKGKFEDRNRDLVIVDDSTMLIHSSYANIDCISETDSEHIHFHDSVNKAVKRGYIPCYKCIKK